MKPDVLVIFPNRPDAMAQLDRAYTLHHYWQADDKDALIDAVGSRIRAIVSTGERGASAELIARLPKLEIVSCFGVGIDAIDRPACAARNIPITNTPDVLSRDVADMGIGLMIMVLRRLRQNDIYLRAGKWQEKMPELATRIAGKKLGIIGLGRIGKEVAKRALAFDMTVAYHGRRPQPDVPWPYHATPEALAAAVDVLLLCCPGGAETKGLVNAAVLDALGPEGFLINVARGSVVDEPALVEALVSNRIKGAGIDVFADEPNVPEALIGLDNVVLSPHMASATTETRDAMAQLVVDNLAAHFAGRPLLTPFR